LRVFAAALACDDGRGRNGYGQQNERRGTGDPSELPCAEEIGRTG
jgi:hypothetical protein